jgi:hypothetical protein
LDAVLEESSDDDMDEAKTLKGEESYGDNPWQKILANEDIRVRVRMVYDGDDKLLDTTKSLKEVNKLVRMQENVPKEVK